MLGSLIGAAGSFLGARKQQKAASKNQKRMLRHLNAVGDELTNSYQDIIDRIMADPSGYAGTRVQAAAYENVDLAQSLANTIRANQQNLGATSNLVSQTNRATLANDIERISGLAPGVMSALQGLSGNAASLSSGQIPQDVIQQIIGARSSQAAATGIPGGSSPATLRDLGMSSMDALNQGSSLLQSILQAGEAISPISRQISAAQFQFNPQTGLQTDLTQALLQQQSQQNAFNLAAAPDPSKSLQTQLQLQMANNTASIKTGQTPYLAEPVMPYAQLYGQIGSSVGQGLGNLFGGMFGGQGSNYNAYSNQGF